MKDTWRAVPCWAMVPGWDPLSVWILLPLTASDSTELSLCRKQREKSRSLRELFLNNFLESEGGLRVGPLVKVTAYTGLSQVLAS